MQMEVVDADVDAALTALLGGEEPPEQAIAQEAPLAVHGAHGDTLADAAAPEMLVALPAEI
jgi:hypothetical protein